MFLFWCHWQHQVQIFGCSFCPIAMVGLPIFLQQRALKLGKLSVANIQTTQLNSMALNRQKDSGSYNFPGCQYGLENLTTFFMIVNTCMLYLQMFCDNSTPFVPHNLIHRVPRLGSISQTVVAIIVMDEQGYLEREFYICC